jgi:succinate dehydrogenase hydrophobic anchor subunit
MPKVQQSTSSRLQSLVSKFKDTFTSDGHVLFCVLCGHFFFFLMHINAYYNAHFNDFRSIFVYFLEL